MFHNILDAMIALGVWINTYINVKHHIDRKKK